MNKISFIATVFNEEKAVDSFLLSLLSQTKKPNEVIIVDGGSTDDTVKKIKKYTLHFKKKNIKFSLFIKKGNIAIGRNYAIKKSTYNIIAISDAGCVLDKKWVKNITEPFNDENIDVVAGFYKGLPSNIFEKSLVPFVLVMPDKAKKGFLPASRSMAIRKKIFDQIGGFSEELDFGEDYDLSNRLATRGARIEFVKKAIVNWKPRSNIFSAFKMFYRYAHGDIMAGNIRPKVVFIFARYFFALSTLLGARFVSQEFLFSLLFVYFGIYSTWAVLKNSKYVKHPSALFYLPLIQITSDMSVIAGSTVAIFERIIKAVLHFAKKEKVVTGAIILFTLLVLSNLNWGLPNLNHPFTYHMDEWHQLQSVRHLFTYLSPNIEGSANGPIFHFALSGLYVGVLALVGLVNPFALNSSLTNLDIQNTLFIYLRLSTLLFALGTIFTLIFILKRQLKVTNIYLPVVLFLFSPIWISLSNYFKYDIALIFWILLSILFIFKFRDNPTLKNYLIAVIPVSLAVTTKISALPLLIVYYLAWLVYGKSLLKNLRFPLIGTFIFGILFLFLGIPDAIIGTGNYFEYFHSNLVRTPNETYNYILGMPYYVYLLTNQIPTLFGFILFGVFLISVIYFLKSLIGKSIFTIMKTKRNEIFLLMSFLIFALSLIPMKLFIINRSLVVLPFVILFVGLIFQKFISQYKNKKRPILFVVAIVLSIHIVQGFSWITTKHNDPRESSAEWIVQNIPNGELIGIENIPIYQFLPDNVLFEYYHQNENKYSYEVIDSKSDVLPKYVIITNSDIDKNYFLGSPKKDLLYRIEREGFQKIRSFEVNRELNRMFTSRLDFYISLLSPTPNIYIYKR